MTANQSDRIQRQIAFLAELDRLKSIVRQSPLIDKSRRENSAEHSWHLAMFALVISEYGGDVDCLHATKLLLLHDIVEIDTGDVPLHAGEEHKQDIQRLEREAAARIFGLLPAVQGCELMECWLEFENVETPESRFAKTLNRLQPLLANVLTGGGT